MAEKKTNGNTILSNNNLKDFENSDEINQRVFEISNNDFNSNVINAVIVVFLADLLSFKKKN